MPNRLLLIDLENVQKVDLSLVPSDAQVLVFYGAMQKNLPAELVVQAQPLGDRLKWIKISGQGRNALDFHIAFYLGQELVHRPGCECVVLSRDTGFDPLIRHLHELKHVCRRVHSLQGAFGDQPRSKEVDPFERLLTLLRKDKAHPTKRKGLAAKVKSWFPKLTAEMQAALVQRLFDESHVRESGNALAFALAKDR